MYKIGNYVVYNKDVCIIKEIKEKYHQNKDYYLLNPIDDNTLKIVVPIDNNNLRSIISENEIKKLLKDIPKIKVIEITNIKNLEQIYKQLLMNDNHYDLIKIIKTAYIRNKERIDNKKKIGEKDDYFFNIAEKKLYNELSISLGLSYEDTKKYVIKEVSKYS